ncbi:hypothetical protein Pmani_016111 [Petrolisthes manimaculis]|uniref:Uncharacterized protein n=1 Tax=Petrolisthes manimaculis TaxID=1843537 RepID=A0AAE1PQI6_9EUCA|nr:hypothetical protein Pmani_016111 [Petrolisthes manimaculis]
MKIFLVARVQTLIERNICFHDVTGYGQKNRSLRFHSYLILMQWKESHHILSQSVSPTASRRVNVLCG